MRKFVLVFLLVVISLMSCTQSTTTSNTTELSKQTTEITADSENIVYLTEDRGDGEPITLINNPQATNPTYAQLLAFLKQDRTDEYSYILGPPKNAYISGDFAEDVHNNAEAAGIRAAWVGIDIAGKSEGHALNAFETTDLGIIFIDCTGHGLWSELQNRTNWDRRARVSVEQQYLVQDIAKAKAQLTFLISIEEYIDEAQRSNWQVKKPLIVDWLKNHDITVIGRNWMQNWIQEHDKELKTIPEEIIPKEIIGSKAGFGDLGTYYQKKSWLINVNCIDFSWFETMADPATDSYDSHIGIDKSQLQNQIIDVDGIPVRWQVGWSLGWTAPLGVVESVRMHW